MRRRRWIGAVVLVGATLGWPSVAWADGGAYLDLDRTHYLPGQTAHAEGYVSVPPAKQHLFERGPFYVFVVPPRTVVREGRPIPANAVRVSTVSIERERGTTFELRSSFVVPELRGDSYWLYICNDPVHDLGLPRAADRNDLDRRHRTRGEAAHGGQPSERADVEPSPAGSQGRARGRRAPSPARRGRGGPFGAGHPRPRARSGRRRKGNPIGPTSVGLDVGGADAGRRVVRRGARARGPAPATPRAGRPGLDHRHERNLGQRRAEGSRRVAFGPWTDRPRSCWPWGC